MVVTPVKGDGAPLARADRGNKGNPATATMIDKPRIFRFISSPVVGAGRLPVSLRPGILGATLTAGDSIAA